MPMIDAEGCLLNVTVEGRDGGPTLILSNSLGCALNMWQPQMAALTLRGQYRRIDSAQSKIILIEGGARILPTFSERLSAKAARRLPPAWRRWT